MGIELGYDETEMRAKGIFAGQGKTKIQEDFVRADIYYQTLNVQTIEQTAKYSV